MFKKAKNKVKNFGTNLMNKGRECVAVVSAKAHKVTAGTKAEAYVDTGVKILIGVVIGALVLGGLYALFDDTVMPTVTEKIEELFDYAG